MLKNKNIMKELENINQIILNEKLDMTFYINYCKRRILTLNYFFTEMEKNKNKDCTNKVKINLIYIYNSFKEEKEKLEKYLNLLNQKK